MVNSQREPSGDPREAGVADKVATTSAKEIKRGRRFWADAMFSYVSITPAMIVLLGFTVYPFILSVIKSFTSRREFSTAQYERMITDDVFHTVIINNIVFAVVTVVGTIIVSLGLALLVVRVMRGSTALRTMVLSPTVLPVVAAGSVWLYVFQPTFGLLNTVLGFFGLPGMNWLGSTATAMPAIMTVTIWQQSGLFVLFYIAALLALDPQLREASLIEGASGWFHFWHVTWPLLMPTTLFVTVIGTANSFKHVDLIFVLTQGGPDNVTNLMLYYIWRAAFAQFRPEYAAAITVVLVLILLAVAVAQIRLLDKRIHYR